MKVASQFNMRVSISFFIIAFAIADARVTFPFSEVLQSRDIMENDGRASFKCDDGCKVYVDLITDELEITEDGIIIANFTDIVGADPAVPDGFELPAGNNYELAYAAGIAYDGPEFTFYAVSVKAPNYGVVVLTVQNGSLPIGKDRFYTILSSFDALQYSDFRGPFSSYYPQIYTTGFDVLDDIYGRNDKTGCSPVYRAKGQYNAEQSAPVMFSPISTIDFGGVGVTHSATANAVSDPLNPQYVHLAGASTVYMSPGYIGCPFEVAQVYRSAVLDALTGTSTDAVSDYFTIIANSLDIEAVPHNVTASEKVTLHVNEDVLDFYNNGTKWFTYNYDNGAYTVYVDWFRSQKKSTAAWTIQLDFGAKTVSTTVTTTTVTTSKPAELSSTTTAPTTTTTSGSALSLLVAISVVLALATTQ